MSTEDVRPAGRDDLSARSGARDVEVEVDAEDLDRDHAELARDPLEKTEATGGTTEPPD
jgi:hypothetical protein